MKRFIISLTAIISALALLLIILLGAVLVYARKNIDYRLDEELFSKAKEESTVYYYAYGEGGELEEVYKNLRSSAREWTDWEEIGDNLKRGFIAVEDREFYEHRGINFRRTVAAVINHIFKIRKSFGASTITQQVIKNISGDNETTVSRKVKEILRAFNLERNHSKDDIFELYLNVIPMAGNIYGVGSASDIYFDKLPSELSLCEAATLIGITNAPTKYNPYTNPEACINKRNRVLYAMLDAGAISREEYDEAVSTPLQLSDKGGDYAVSPWFVETATEDILADISHKYGLSYAAARLMLNGSKIVLTMDTKVQKIMEDYFEDTSNLSDKVNIGLNYSMVITDPYSGDLLGIIGNGGRKNGNLLFNYATAPVTPGSVLKPLALYAPLLESGAISWSTMIEDTPTQFMGEGENKTPYPKNSPDVYDGLIDVSTALKRSKNTVAVRLLEMLGTETAFNHLRDAYGFTGLVRSEISPSGSVISDLGPSPLALGQLSYGLSLRALTEAYGAFANSGVLCAGRSYVAVYGRDGKQIISKERSAKRIYSVETAQLMTQLLMGVVDDGTARQIKLKENVDVAGKTGTSGNDRDRLFIGYTPYYVAGIWTGYGKDNKEVGFNSPSHIEIWDEVMKRIHDALIFTGYDESQMSFNTDSLVVAPYCSRSGATPSELCELDEDATEKLGYFKQTDLPKSVCDYH